MATKRSSRPSPAAVTETPPIAAKRRPRLSPPPLNESPVVDRDLSWLEFNRRVLEEACDDRTPLLERLKFLAIFSSNLDEFFMKRLEILRQSAILPGPSASTQILDHCRAALLPLLKQQAEMFRKVVRLLRDEGVRLLDWAELTPAQHAESRAHFLQNVLPVLTPLAVDPSHPFPFLSNLSISLGVTLRDPATGDERFARLKIPNTLPGWVRLKVDVAPDELAFVRLLSIVRNHLDLVFPGMEIITVTAFRVTRDAEVELNEETHDLRSHVVDQLRQRRFEPVVRLEFETGPDPRVRDLLRSKFELAESELYELPGELDYTALMKLAFLPRPDLRDPPWEPHDPPAFADRNGDLFATIRAGDVLVHHPYDSFEASVERFITSAALDPAVRAIKMTVYRVGDDTPFVAALVRAAEAGKQVVCLIEVRARFDEERNLEWAAQLERAGAHVVYGVMGLKTHTKISLVVREEADGLRSYAHIGTGNYHVKTARLYTDLGLFTCDPELTDDVVQIFHFLTGFSRKDDYRALLVSPVTMRPRFLEMIDREIAHQKAGRPARIIAKMNQLEDPEIIQALYRASSAGVDVDLTIRGFCCLRPGVAGLSERIRVISIIGRFLEHSRIFHFANGAKPPQGGEFYIGSADWMTRNLSARVEAVAPVRSPALKDRLWEILEIGLADQRQAWDMQPDGTYIQRRPAANGDGAAAEGTQQTLMNLTRQRVLSLNDGLGSDLLAKEI